MKLVRTLGRLYGLAGVCLLASWLRRAARCAAAAAAVVSGQNGLLPKWPPLLQVKTAVTRC